MVACQYCRKSPKNPSVAWCENCFKPNNQEQLGRVMGQPLCRTCLDRHNENEFTAEHQTIPIELFQVLNSSLSYTGTTNDYQNDAIKSTLIFVNPLDFKILLGGCYYEMGFILPEHACPSVISFVGKTGVGKSLLIRMLMVLFNTNNQFRYDEFGLPIPGHSSAVESTSCDLHLYRGPNLKEAEVGHDPDEFPILFIDAEGIEGSAEPKGLSYILSQFFALVAGHNRDAYLKARKKVVNLCYPKLQYVFSDAICYVTENWKQREDVIARLLSWARDSVSGIINKSFKPKLFIIFNKAELDEEKDLLDVKNATARFFGEDGRFKLELDQYYSDPTVIVVPNAKAHLSMAKSQLDKLKDLVVPSLEKSREVRLRVGQHFNIKSFRRSFFKAIQLLNKQIAGGSDISEISLDLNSANNIESGTADCLLKYFRAIKEICPFEEALVLFKSRLRDSPFLSMLRSGFGCAVGDPKNYVPLPVDHNYVINVDNEEIDTNNPRVDCPMDWLTLLTEKIEPQIMLERPCGATKIFEGVNGRFQAHCVCNRKEHALHTTGKTYEPVHWLHFLGMRSGAAPVSWEDANYALNLQNEELHLQATLCDQIIKFQVWDERYIYKHHFQRLSKHRNSMLELFSRGFVDCCLGCVISPATEKLVCQHTLCINCCKEMNEYNNGDCPICGAHCNWHDASLLPTQGYRVLSLDGGGVRGIVELKILSAIEGRLGIPIKNLFDFVIGTSTGAVVIGGVYLSNCESADRCLALARKLIDAAFGNPFPLTGVPILGPVLRFLYYKAKYDPSKFQEALTEIFAEQKLLFSSSIKVAITSCLNESNFPAVLFTTYNRALDSQEVDPLTKINDRQTVTIVQAIRSSSAAGFHLPTVEMNGQSYTDGGMQNNCPALIGLEEAKRIWPSNSLDFVFSVGTGTCNETEHESSSLDDIISFVSRSINLTTSTHIKWAAVQQQHDAERAFRANPLFPEHVELDNHKAVDKLILFTDNYLSSQRGINEINFACARILASLFYMVPLAGYHFEEVVIKSRMNVPSRARKLVIGFRGDYGLNIETTSLRADLNWMQQGTLVVTKRISDVPPLRPIVFSAIEAGVQFEDGGKIFWSKISGIPLSVNEG